MAKEGNHGRLGQQEMTPVSRAIARHMGVDLSPEGLAARNRRGIAIIVYGAPLTGEAVENCRFCIGRSKMIVGYFKTNIHLVGYNEYPCVYNAYVAVIRSERLS